MFNLKKLLQTAVLSLGVASTASLAAPSGIISIEYYADSTKQELIGYWYQSCYLNFKVLWGVREGYRAYDPMHGQDCTQLGEYSNRRAMCFSEKFNQAANGTGVVGRDEVEYIKSQC
ncbi:hypothetical protein [Pseudoalteromonas sp. MMG022]|uniref:hypothetical protein n=1 Tax=Pseudoalteromonas sp. MMG022 TaxID=2909978 RepID=UPI001F46FF81|nr:hypothetical protein [Pseudoalteromonas sp. MMG022]MCF6437113.1 hypothetical protein [Pseudoalteromonas sp. MMG022]